MTKLRILVVCMHKLDALDFLSNLHFIFIFKNLTHDNLSFILIVDKESRVVITNNNTHIISQRIKLYIYNFLFSFTSMSFVTMVTCNLTRF
jgi:hypothetical protein